MFVGDEFVRLLIWYVLCRPSYDPGPYHDARAVGGDMQMTNAGYEDDTLPVSDRYRAPDVVADNNYSYGTDDNKVSQIRCTQSVSVYSHRILPEVR